MPVPPNSPIRLARACALAVAVALGFAFTSASAAAADTTFAPSADAQVKSSSPTTNYGSDAGLRLRQGTPDNTITYRTYLKFTVTGLTGSVTTAKLRLYVTDASNDGGTAFLAGNDFSTGGAWTESGLTWSNAPGASSGPLGSAGSVATGTWAEFPVTLALTGNATYTFLLTTASSDSAIFSSKEGGNAPQLVVTTGAGSATPPSNTNPPLISGTTQVGLPAHGESRFVVRNRADHVRLSVAAVYHAGVVPANCERHRADLHPRCRRSRNDDPRPSHRDRRGGTAGGRADRRGRSDHRGVPADVTDEHAVANDHRQPSAGPDSERQSWSVVRDGADHLRVPVATLLGRDLRRHPSVEIPQDYICSIADGREQDDQGEGDGDRRGSAARRRLLRSGRAGCTVQRGRQRHAHDRRRHRL